MIIHEDLLQLINVYPLHMRAFDNIAEKLTPIKSQHDMQDLQAMAQRYSQMMEKQRSCALAS